jgi:predicted CoA-binding protein
MATLPAGIADFLSSRRIAVAGVSRTGASAGNPVFRKLRKAGYEVFPVNPNASELEGVRAYPSVGAIGAPIDGVMIATHPDAAATVVRDAADAGVRRIWFHRSFGQGSVSDAAVDECRARGLSCIVGGCPLMFCEPVDVGHRCMRWWLQRSGRVPK